MKKLFLILLICFVIQTILTSKTVTYGGSVSEFERKINGLVNDNQELELLVASQVSCATIAQKATQAGYALTLKAEPKVDLSVALRR
ncbi:MAG TPA: hypothetical protein VMW04_01635 [Patescibacteria group bacterium]|nr:hypothetical protein [Patescibacteria group bacterium]